MNRLLVVATLTDRYYAAIQMETGYLFHYCTRHGDVDRREFDRAVAEPGPKDIVIDRDQILEKQLRVLSHYEQFRTTGSGCSYVVLRTAEKTYRFNVLGKHGEAELRRFFDVSDAELVLPERHTDYGKSLERNEKDENKYIFLFALCILLDLAVLVTIFLLPYRPWLILGLIAVLLPVGLALLHPEWYSLTRGSEEARYLYGKKLLPAAVLLFIPPFLLMMGTPQLTYLSEARALLIGMLPVAALSVVVWLLSREKATSPAILAAVLAMWTLLSSGVGLAINALDYFYQPPALTEHRRITALERRVGRGGASYFVTTGAGEDELVLWVTKEYYDTLSVGDFVIVDFYDGALGVPYAEIYEP